MSAGQQAFIFGKFAPFHQGHAALIAFGLRHCHSLTVLVCCSDRENLAAELRKGWVEAAFKNEPRIQVRILRYLEEELPNTSVSSREVSRLWAEKFREVVPHCSMVVTSEPYGEYVAEFMAIQHLSFDPERTAVPVSASQIRMHRQTYWHYLPEVVRPHYIRKVVLLGTESTGKSTLAQQLAAHFNATLVAETAREFILDSNSFTIEDLEGVAREHARRIRQGMQGASSLMFIDTDIHITQSYARHTFGALLDLPEELYHINKADLYLYLKNDIPYQQDGSRLAEEAARALDASHRKIAEQFRLPVSEISGSRENRFAQAVVLVDDLLAGN